MKYICLCCNVNNVLNKTLFLKTSRQFKNKNVAKSVNEFMDLCELELQQNSKIEVWGYYTKKTHAVNYTIGDLTFYTPKSTNVRAGWKVLRNKFKRRFGNTIEILHKKYSPTIIVKNINIGSNVLKEI